MNIFMEMRSTLTVEDIKLMNIVVEDSTEIQNENTHASRTARIERKNVNELTFETRMNYIHEEIRRLTELPKSDTGKIFFSQ